MSDIELKLNEYQDRYNLKFNKNFVFDGTIKYNKIKSGYVIWIRLVVFNLSNIIYDYSKEFIVFIDQIKNSNNKSLFMDKFEIINILNDIDTSIDIDIEKSNVINKVYLNEHITLSQIESSN